MKKTLKKSHVNTLSRKYPGTDINGDEVEVHLTKVWDHRFGWKYKVYLVVDLSMIIVYKSKDLRSATWFHKGYAAGMKKLLDPQ